MKQHTIEHSFTLRGVGIHTGAIGSITVHPGDVNFGRRFLAGGVAFAAHVDNVVDTTRCTAVGCEGVRVSTVEHLLSALAGLGVDNVLIEVDGPEIPILDGSAGPFVEAILAAGIAAQDADARVMTIASAHSYSAGASSVAISPSPAFCVEAVTDFDDWPEGTAAVRHVEDAHGAQTYASRIAPARTFAFRREVEMLLAAGLAKGGSLDNALIITPPDQFSSPLRVEQEWCAHKALDLIGDLALTNARFAVSVTARRPGHRLNVETARYLAEHGSELIMQERQ